MVSSARDESLFLSQQSHAAPATQGAHTWGALSLGAPCAARPASTVPFFIIVVAKAVKWYLIVVLIYIFFMTDDVEHFL